MLIERARCGEGGQCFLFARPLIFFFAWCTLTWGSQFAAGADYTIRTISEPTLFSRDPVISETRLIAWGANDPQAGQAPGQFIMIHTNGTSRSLFTVAPGDLLSTLRPQAQSNMVVFVAVMPPSRREAWKLRQVPAPERDTPTKEIPAIYRLELVQDGQQEWVLVSEQELEQQAAAAALETSRDAIAAAAGAAAEPAAGPAVTGEVISATGEVAAAESVQPPAPVVVVPEPPVVEPVPDETQLKDLPRRLGSGDTELLLWRGESVLRITSDNRDDLGPSIWGNLVAWQTAKAWPFGWEIMAWSDGHFVQLTTNFYYDMAPKVHEHRIVWYGWDGHDFEIFLYDHAKGTTVQITSNLFDDISPEIWGDVIVWEGYATANADVFMWRNETITKLSNNPEDDLNPRVWDGKVVWQGYDGEDFEIFYFDGGKTVRLTSNTFDDVNPDIRDGVICWMGYEGNWDAEIYVRVGGSDSQRLTDNNEEDRNPRTAAGWVVWESVSRTSSVIQVAEPKK